MKKLILSLLAILVLTVVWYGVWRTMLAGDVARVKSSIAYQDARFKKTTNNIVLKADSVEPVGFPFAFRIGITRLTLSIIDGENTYAVSLPETYLESTNEAEGRYRVIVPNTFDALFATNGAAPESYKVTVNPMPIAAVRAQGPSSECSNMPGSTRCPAVAEDAPIMTYAVQVPRSLILHMELNGQSKDAKFDMIPMDLPIFQTIPNQMDKPLELFVGILREALVYKTGQ